MKWKMPFFKMCEVFTAFFFDVFIFNRFRYVSCVLTVSVFLGSPAFFYSSKTCFLGELETLSCTQVWIWMWIVVFLNVAQQRAGDLSRASPCLHPMTAEMGFRRPLSSCTLEQVRNKNVIDGEMDELTYINFHSVLLQSAGWTSNKKQWAGQIEKERY